MSKTCLIVSDGINNLTENIIKAYPEASKREGLTPEMVAEWVGSYSQAYNKEVDFIPSAGILVNYIERLRNLEGKSFKYTPESIEYTYQGSKKTYSVIGSHIYNKDGKEVFATDSKDRRKIFANLAVQQGRAVVVTYKDKKYVVNNRNQIISVTTGDEMKWGEENGDRKAILALSKAAFEAKQKAETTTINSNVALEESENYVRQLIEHLKTSGINVFDKTAMDKFFKEHPNMALYIQQAIDNRNNNSTLYNYGTDRRTEENQQFPEILGNAGREKEASRTLATAANDARRGQSNDDREEGFPKEKFLAYLEVSARQQGTWIDDVNSLGNKLRDRGGAESELYLSKDGKSYIKLNRFTMLDEQHNIEEFVDRINSHNEFEKYAPYSILGFAEDSKGNVCIALKQPLIKGKEATQKEIDDFLGNVLHYEWKTLSDGAEGWTNGVYEIWDADPSNVLKDSKNNLYFIDIVINNTERLAKYRTIDNIQMMQTSQGEIYGFVDKDGNMYLDETIIDASHPIHEYTHLWDRALEKNNPELWKKGVKLMQEGVPSLWNEIANSENYGKLWQSKGIKGERLVNLIASEVHARLVGDNGAKLLDRIAKEQGNNSIIAKLKQWILDAWKELKATFSNWSQEEIDKLTLKDFNHMTVMDFADGINPNTVSSPSQAASNNSNLNVVTFGSSPTAEQQATAQANINKLNEPKSIDSRPEEPDSDAFKSALKINNSRVAEFKRTFSPQQVKDRGALISSIFSREVDEALWDEIDAQLEVTESDTATDTQKEEARQRLIVLKDPLRGRQAVVEEKGLPYFIDAIKQQLQWDLEAAEEGVKPLWKNTIDYFEDLFNAQAALDIEEREGIRIVNLKLVEKSVAEEDNDSQDDGDDEVGNLASGSDGWSYKIRYVNPFDSLSKKVKGMLYEVEREEKDDLGQTKYYPMGQIYGSLLAFLSKHMQDSDEFIQINKDFEGKDRCGNDITETTYPNGYPVFPTLEQMKASYPWVQQIIDKLTDDYLNPDWNSSLRYPSTGGAIASQFYTNFRKAYIPYGKVQLGDNDFGITPLNYQMEDRAQYDKLEANYNNRMILTDTSVYDANGKISKENTRELKKKISKVILDLGQHDYYQYPELMAYNSQHPEEEVLTQKEIDAYNQFILDARNVLQSFGIDATQDGVVAYLMMKPDGSELHKMLADVDYIADTILKVDDSKIDSFNYILDLRNPYNESLWKHFFDNRGLITDASYMQSFYDSASKKTKYSYSADNYLMKTFRGVCMGSLEDRRAFIDEKFGKFEWFKNQNTREWRNKWLEFWYNYDDEQKEIPYRNIDNITEYGNEGTFIRPYVKWTPDDVWQVQNRSYGPNSSSKTTYYLAPIFSDAPMSMTVKGPRMTMEELLYGYTDKNNDYHQGALVSLVNQELWRIKYVQERAQHIKDGTVKPIANFDTGVGNLFCFLPELNTYVFEDTGELFLDRMVRLNNEGATARDIEADQIQAIGNIIDARMENYIAENSEHYENNALKDEDYYNMVYANAAIIQLTTVDLAYYGKGQRKTTNDTLYQMTVDFQKRFKEVYSGGIQLNTNSKYGKKTENIILLEDDVITSPSYDKIASIIDGSNNLSESDKEDIKATFTDINVADAQAIRSMHSFRSVLDMMGNWTDEMEQALQHFKEGVWDRADFDIIYQTIKPFVYSVIERNDGNGGNILVPQQNKNSEICALMMYDLISNGLNNSPVYKALSRFMDNNRGADGEHLIDMVQFESAGKVGNQGVISINYNANNIRKAITKEWEEGNKRDEEVRDLLDKYDFNVDSPNDNNAGSNYRAIKEQLDSLLQMKKISQEDYNKIMSYLRPTEEEIISILEQKALITNPDGTKSINTEVVHTIPFDNYYQQQPTPQHHIDNEATFGSQARNIIVADLPDDLELTVPGKSGKQVIKGKDAIIDFYYELLDENLIEDFFGKGGKSGLKGVFKDKKSFRDAVIDVVRGNPKYGRDFAEALQLDDSNNFVLNPNSPTIFNLMQEIVTSFFKNRITKQTINGASLIQAAGIGLNKDLRVIFNDKGKLVGAECLMPLTSKRFFEPLLETQVINGEEVKVLTLEKLKKAGLDKAIGYRIPTENKSSMMPLIIKGFTPLQNGSAIVLPAEITNIAGSDFDVDKMFIMLLSFNVITHDKKRAFNDYARQEHQAAQEMINALGKSNIEDLEIEEIGKNFAEWFKEHESEYLLDEPRIKRIEYDFSKTPKENGRRARNNMIILLMHGILTSKEGAESLFNPQGFKDFKRAAKVNRILNDEALKDRLLATTSEEGAYNFLLNSPTKKLENYIADYSTAESPIYPQTFAHSHARNMAGVNQIGIYAVQASMCAKYQRAHIELLPEQQFTLNGRVISKVDVSDGGKRFKNVGQPLGASADNGKDPNLSDAGSTLTTAPIIGYMLRLGLNHLEAVLIMNQPHMRLSGYSTKKGYWEGILGKNFLRNPVNVNTKTLIKSLLQPAELTQEEDMAIAGLCYRVLSQYKAQEYLTQISRADSPNGSMQNSYAKARIQNYKVDLFQAKMSQPSFPFFKIKEALSNDAVDITASEGVVRKQLKEQPMAFLHGMYALGINSFNSLVSPYFFGAESWFDDRIVKPILYNLNESLSDEKKTDIVNKIYLSYITYKLSGSSLFSNEDGNSMKQKRDYYLKTFPSEYLQIIHDNKEIRDLLGNILQVKNFGSRNRIILQDVGSLSKGQKQEAQRRLEGLFYIKDPEVAKIGKDLATKLLMYSYYDNGLQFTHDSFSHLFTTGYLTNFPVYNETLNSLSEEPSVEEEQNFIYQLLLTYPDVAYKVDSLANVAEITDNAIKFDLHNSWVRGKLINELMSPNPMLNGINVYPYISYNGEVYVLNQDLFNQEPGRPVYNKLATYQTYPKLPLFSSQMSILELAEQFPTNIEEREKEELPSVDGVDTPITHNEGNEDPSIAPNSMYSEFENMDNGFDFPDPEDASQAKEVTPTDNYLSEGQSELKDPFC